MWDDIGTGMLRTLAYVGVGAVVLMFGYYVHDVLTPGKLGKLGKLICDDRNVNVTLVTASNLFASGLIVTVSILTTHETFKEGITSTAAFGLLGVLLLAIAEVVLDKLTPGKLGELMQDTRFHPLAAFTATTNVIVGMIVAVSIS